MEYSETGEESVKIVSGTMTETISSERSITNIEKENIVNYKRLSYENF